jgi:hypothetical protein
MKLGQPKYEKSTKNYFAFKKDQNTFILRILPPLGELAESGKWSVFHRVEFGHLGTDGRMKPFLSPRVVNFDGMVEVESESHTRRESLKTQLEQAKAAGNAGLVEQITTLLRKYNQDSKHYMNVVDLQGNIGLFKIGHRGFQALKAQIEKLRSEGIDPIGIENGRFFVFSRSGKGRDTVYTVNEYKQKTEIDGPTGKMLVDAPFPHSINDSILSKLDTDAFELNKVYPSITAEQESRILNEGATAVDEILGNKKKEQAPVNPASVAKTESLNTEALAQTVADATANESLNISTQPLETTVASTTSGTTEMSEEEFFKKIESGNF